MGGLDFEILFHHRRDARICVSGGRGFGGRGGGDGLLDRHQVGRKLQNFAARSYSLTCVVRVFHARRLKFITPALRA